MYTCPSEDHVFDLQMIHQVIINDPSINLSKDVMNHLYFME